MNAILNYPGAKWGMAQMLCGLMPKHRSYLEPYFGSGAVLFNKPASPIETVNDLDGEVVNFFRVMREQPEKLAAKILMTPYSREAFDDAYENRGEGSAIERAYRFAIRSKMGHGFKTYQKTGFKIDVAGREASYALRYWNALPEQIVAMAARLKEVQIEHMNALELIPRFNFDNVLIYADPPYLMRTRGGKQYREEMETEEEHIALIRLLRDHKGYVILSAYPSDLYERELRGWIQIQQKSYNQNADRRTECIWCNFEVPSIFLGDQGGMKL